MNARKSFSSPTVLLAVVIMLSLAVGLTQAQEPKPPGELETLGPVKGPEEPNSLLLSSVSDDFQDLAVGVQYEDVGSVVHAGAVNVIYGKDGVGLFDEGNQLWHQDTSDVPEDPEEGDLFGAALAMGDFDGNGLMDLASGVAYQDMGSVVNVVDAGAVLVLYGARGGFSATDNQMWSQAYSGVLDEAETDDWFGSALAVGDFDSDGFDDLAVGVWAEDMSGQDDAGAVNVIYGSSTGLTLTGDQLWYQGLPTISGGGEAGDYFGFSLASADFDNDGYDDLAVGAVNEAIGDIADAGSVNIIYGSPGGLSAAGNQWLYQGLSVINDESEAGDQFGWALAAGDYDGDGYADLAVGVPGENVVEVDAGAVSLIYGSDSGLTGDRDQFWYQNNANIESTPEEGDRFGRALTAGDFDADGRDDLAVGIPFDNVDDASSAGGVVVMRGTPGGLSAVSSWWIHQDISTIANSSQTNDYFGRALAAGAFDGDSYPDLAIGVTGEKVGTVVDAGAVSVIYGSLGGLSAAGNLLWHQDFLTTEGVAETGDQFGYTLASYYRREIYNVYLPFVVRD